MSCFVRRVEHVFSEGADGHAVVAPEATELLWLVGRVSSSGVFVWSVMNCSKDPGESLQQAASVLPQGLEILGVLCADWTKPEWPPEIASIASASSQLARGLLLLATRAEDGRLKAWDMQRGLERSHWKVSEPSEICAYSSLSIVLPKIEAEAMVLLSSLASDLSAIRFRFPGTELVPSLADFIDEVNVPCSVPESGLLAVEVLSEALGSEGHSNFAEFHCQAQAEHRIDFAAYVPPNSMLQVVAQSLVQAAEFQLRQLIREVSQDRLAKGTSFAVRCYQLEQHVVCVRGAEVQTTRLELHRLLRLPAAPLLVPSAALPLAGQAPVMATGKPRNPHSSCGSKPSWWRGSASTRVAFVKGIYEYHHYMQDNFDDSGWGCAYRSLQTCVSWYRMQHYSRASVPSIPDIQNLLKQIDEAHRELEVGSKKWIGTVEGMYLLQEYLQVDCKMMYCQDATDMASQAQQMLQHLETEGTPIMMGAGMYAYTLVGLCFDSVTGDVAYLIVDPHYPGQDDIKPILQKGWVGWKNLDFFDKSTEGSFINCCLPLVPRGLEHL
ncbi:ufsp2 [Symbiodinium microadriaticum]|nr:ufsp2 [Symbiodinium sp. KB8]CAE7746318.1 ufsp2 [Symbiodinium microadriaticum]